MTSSRRPAGQDRETNGQRQRTRARSAQNAGWCIRIFAGRSRSAARSAQTGSVAANHATRPRNQFLEAPSCHPAECNHLTCTPKHSSCALCGDNRFGRSCGMSRRAVRGTVAAPPNHRDLVGMRGRFSGHTAIPAHCDCGLSRSVRDMIGVACGATQVVRSALQRSRRLLPVAPQRRGFRTERRRLCVVASALIAGAQHVRGLPRTLFVAASSVCAFCARRFEGLLPSPVRRWALEVIRTA